MPWRVDMRELSTLFQAVIYLLFWHEIEVQANPNVPLFSANFPSAIPLDLPINFQYLLTRDIVFIVLRPI